MAQIKLCEALNKTKTSKEAEKVCMGDGERTW